MEIGTCPLRNDEQVLKYVGRDIDMINTVSISSPGSLAAITVAKTEIKTIESKVVGPEPINISTLSCQLNESAERAKASYEGLDRKQLFDKATAINNQFSNDNYYKRRVAVHDKEVPATHDTELLERARLATRFVAQAIHGNINAENPFAGLSRDQLTLIEYDDSGPYTMNERMAASYEADRLEQHWRTATLGKLFIEGQAAGGLEFYTEVLQHFRALPLIEQVQSPEDYEERLEDWIRQAGGEPEKPQRLLNLFEVLAGLRLRKPKEDEEEQPEEAIKAPPAIKTNNLSPDACPTPADARRNSPSPVVPRTDG